MKPTFRLILIRTKVKGRLTFAMIKNNIYVSVCARLAWDQSIGTHQLINIYEQIRSSDIFDSRVNVSHEKFHRKSS